LVTRREEFQAFAVDNTIQPAVLEERGAEASSVDGTVSWTAAGLSTIFPNPPVEVFQHTITPASYELAVALSEHKIKIIIYLGTSVDFIDGVRVLFEGWMSSPAVAPVPVA
jgi:hypothetical protein